MDHLDLSYEKLNDLLDECYWAERRYYNAVEDIQNKEYKYFLSHESVNRNRFCHKIASRMSQEKMEPTRLDITKGYANSDWLEVKATFENNKPRTLIAACVVQDEIVLSLLKEIIDDGWLPVSILEVLVPIELEIKKSLEDLAKLKKKLKKKKQKKKVKKSSKIAIIDFVQRAISKQ